MDSGIHDHLFNEIAYVSRGEADHCTCSGTERIAAGTLIIIRPQMWHGYAKCSPDMIVTNCLFSPPLLQQLIPLMEDGPQTTNLFRMKSPDPVHTPPTAMHIKDEPRLVIEQILSRMREEQAHKRYAWRSACSAALLELLILISRQYEPPMQSNMSATTETAVLQAAHWIETHLDENVSLPLLASITDMSEGHLSRHFSARMGMGVVDYQHQLRIEEACRLLRLTNMSITDIAVRSGYLETAYFSRCFKKIMGISAREYRKGKGAI